MNIKCAAAVHAQYWIIDISWPAGWGESGAGQALTRPLKGNRA